ncbi:putative monocarboxylate transporter [Elsinoe ampelina]|uniref:Putative monocarboxylate transporter n=1 Tax=Elsinoe ampelina TaxID=302913 RepID=A0A6A6GP78_9PEZI|nr:putative monocarboxylate transporter [Elsinoe ampelina]
MQSSTTLELRDVAAASHEIEIEQYTPTSPPTSRWTGRHLHVLVSCSVLQLPIWGFAMTYGIFQEYYQSNWTFQGNKDIAGVIGTTSNGVMYLSMPFLFALLSRRWARYRRVAAVVGIILACLSFLLSSFSTKVWQLVITQGVLSALGCALIYSPTTLSLSENFDSSNRALALGIVLSSKNIVGTACPFLLHYLLSNYSITLVLRIWTAIALVSSLPCLLMPMHSLSYDPQLPIRARNIPWAFLRRPAIYIHASATLLQSSGYGLPQTYLTTYASTVALSPTSTTLLLTLFNAPGIISSSFFGFLSDNRRFRLSASATAFISAFASALAVFCFWGSSSGSNNAMVLLSLFAAIYGFFAGGYSATWGGMIKEMEQESADRNEAVDSGVVYGLLNGARGVGYTAGGLIGVQLLKVGEDSNMVGAGYGSIYGPLIIYTGLATVCGGWGVMRGLGGLLR